MFSNTCFHFLPLEFSSGFSIWENSSSQLLSLRCVTLQVVIPTQILATFYVLEVDNIIFYGDKFYRASL